jgi:hypothetical protein
MAATETIHNPDRYMSDLRQILSQGRKRIGLLVGAGAPTAIRLSSATGKIDEAGEALIPDVTHLTEFVIGSLKEKNAIVVAALRKDLIPTFGALPNIETILSRIRLLSQAIGSETVHSLNAGEFEALGKTICELIGVRVSVKLPDEANPYSELVAWISGTNRDYPVEIFTPNYDLLFEEAFERASLPYFDGFSGGHAPFFDPASVSNDILPSRWSRIWKLHGSLGWEIRDDRIIRTGARSATELIYPDHLKYDKIQRMPYSALFERLRTFLMTPDCLLLCSGFSFFDAHIGAVIEESLSANPHAAVFAFQYNVLADESLVASLAAKRPNLSVYAKDGAVISSIRGNWQPGQDPTKDWPEIRNTFWGLRPGSTKPHFLLGDFKRLARFCAMAQALQLAPEPHVVNADSGLKSGDDHAAA